MEATAGSQPSAVGQKRPRQHSKIPSEWSLEFPSSGTTLGSFGGCRRVEDAYENLAQLGQGTYGEVFKARDKVSGEMVALKKIKMENEKEGFPITAIREIKILSRLAASNDTLSGDLMRNNIIKLREIVRSDSHESNNRKGSVYMVFDYMEHDMAGLLDRAATQKLQEAKVRGLKTPEPPFAPGQVKRFMKQLFLGLALLQANSILHRDLKNANLLISDSGELKIGDFGLARTFYKKKKPEKEEEGVKSEDQNVIMTNRVITLWYRPPELCLGSVWYGPEVDMWSAGCIMYEMLTGKPLFPGKHEADQLVQICDVLGEPTEASVPGCETAWKDYHKMMDAAYAQSIQGFPKTSRLRSYLQGKGIKDPLALDLLEKLLALNPERRVLAWKASQDMWFSAEPKMFELSEMPKYEESHELSMKNIKAAEHKARRETQAGMVAAAEQYQQQYQQQQGRGGYGGGSQGRRQGGSQPAAMPSWQQERR